MGLHYLNVIHTKKEVIVAVCDQELRGKTLREGKLEVTLNPEFYGDRLETTEKCVKEFAKATILNLFGNEIVENAIRAGYIDRRNTIRIQGQLHAQLVKV